MKKINDNSLYLVITEEYGRGRSALEIALAAIAGGVDIIQMREKHKARSELLALGKGLASLCRKSGVIFIVNDDPALAKEIGADGVHLGQEDARKNSIKEARALLGKDRMIGVSTHSPDQFKAANDSDIAYIAFGPIFPTKTKDYFIGASGIKNVLKIAKKPVFFIGGINLSNIGEVLKESAKNIALIRAVLEADDITSRVMEFKKEIVSSCATRFARVQGSR